MVLWELATYFFGATANLVVVMFLLGVKFELGKGESFYTVKHYMAMCALVDVLLYSCDLLCMYEGVDYMLLDNFVVPVLFYIQVYLITIAFFNLLHLPIRLDRRQILYSVPIIGMTALYIAAYCIKSDYTFTATAYSEFVSTKLAHVLSGFIYAVVVTEVVTVMVVVSVRVLKYRKTIGNFFSGAQETSGAKIPMMVGGLIIYIIMASLDFILSSEVADLIFMWVNTFLYMIFSVIVMNMQVVYSKMTPAFSQKLPDKASYQADLVAVETELPEKLDVRTDDAEKDNAAARRYVEDIVTVWSGRADHPFLKDGITLGTAASEMGISPRFLSGYINDIFDVNFNTWINMLRVNFVKEELKNGSEASMTELAGKAGFSDLPAFSRTFKRIEGMTPSEYKRTLKPAS